MIAKLRAFMATEVFKYLFFGVLATLVYMVSRTLIFQFTQQGTLSAVLAKHASYYVNSLDGFGGVISMTSYDRHN